MFQYVEEERKLEFLMWNWLVSTKVFWVKNRVSLENLRSKKFRGSLKKKKKKKKKMKKKNKKKKKKKKQKNMKTQKKKKNEE